MEKIKTINVAELLKDCPKGMELDCTMYDNCTFDGIENVGYINILVKTPSGIIRLTKEGCYIYHDDYAKCIIFPKGKDTWENFVPPCKFKDGDIIATNNGTWIGITTGGVIGSYILTYCVIKENCTFDAYLDKKEKWVFDRLATEEEKQKLFKAIKENGYRWNAETKTLEKLFEPKFKVGDIVRHKENKKQHMITKIHQDCYECDDRYILTFENQDKHELVPDKFDISTLVPFESKVLVRDCESDVWKPAIFGGYIDNCFLDETDPFKYIVMGETFYKHLIPYEGNEHLLCTNNDCIEYYKTWEE